MFYSLEPCQTVGKVVMVRNEWKQRHYLPQGILEGSWEWGMEVGTHFFRRHWCCLLSVWRQDSEHNRESELFFQSSWPSWMAWLCITFAFYLQTAELVLQMGIARCQKKHLSLLTGKSRTLPAQWQSDALILAGDDPKGANETLLRGKTWAGEKG